MENKFALYAIVLLGMIIFAALIFAGVHHSRYINPGGPCIGSNGQLCGYRRLQNGSTSLATNTITISATGTAYNTSTQAQIEITINGTGSTNNAAVQNITKTLASFNSTISKYINENASDISTSYFDVYKIYNASGYEAEESITVIVPNINNVTDVLSAISSIPYVYVSGANPVLSNSQTSALRVKALSLALSNATAQAYALIGSNQTIYSTNISVNNYYVYPFGYASGGALSASGNATALNGNLTTSGENMTAIPPGEVNITPQFYGGRNSVTERITVTFVYGPKN